MKPFGCLRRGIHITVLIKQTNKEISGEFLGRLVLGIEDDVVESFWSNDLLIKKFILNLNIYLTNSKLGVFTVVMLFSNIKIIKQAQKLKRYLCKSRYSY